jgi:hypothetical protein
MSFSFNSGTVNVSSATTSSTNFLSNKLNSTQSNVNQQQHYQSTMAPRFMNNYNPLSPTTLSNQIKNSLQQTNSISLGQQQQHNMQQSNNNDSTNSFQQRNNFAINSSNLLYPLNLNSLNAAAAVLGNNNNNNNNSNNSNNNNNQFQQLTNPTLLASVLAANTTCSLNNTLFVGNLHASLQEMDLVQVFRPFGRIVECCKKWLHFGFVKFTSEEEACHAYVTLNGFRLKGRPMRLEFQNRTKKVIFFFKKKIVI